jgi:hypothetical protein
MTLHRHDTRKFAPDPGPGGGGGGGTPAPWFSPAADAPQDFKDWVGTKNFPDAGAALLSGFNAEKLLGPDKDRLVTWPKDDKDADAWKGIHAKLGVPEKAEDYGLAAVEGEDATFASSFAALAHANKLPKAAAASMLNSIREMAKKAGETAEAAAQTKSQAEMTQLETEWGTAATANKELARRFAGELGATAEQMGAIEAAIGTAAFMKLFHKGGTKLGEQRAVPGDGKGGFGITQADARAQLNQARADRVAGKINETDFHALMSRLGPIAEPGTSAAA